MTKVFKIYSTNFDNGIFEGAIIEKKQLKCGVEIPCILVGEEGRGRTLGVLPVVAKDKIIKYATIGKTLKGNPKLIEVPPGKIDGVILILKAPIGYRGYNLFYTKILTPTIGGEFKLINDYWVNGPIIIPKDYVSSQTEKIILKEVRPYVNPCLGDIIVDVIEKDDIITKRFGSNYIKKYILEDNKFEILAKGVIAQGEAGRMGSGDQMVIKVTSPLELHLKIDGRRYGLPHKYTIVVKDNFEVELK